MRRFGESIRGFILKTIFLASTGVLVADPNVVGDGQAHLVDVKADGTVEFLSPSSDVYPDNGVIEVYEEWLPFYNEGHPDYATDYVPKRVHMFAKSYHDMLIPLGRFMAGEVEVKYSGSDGNGHFSGSIIVGHAWDNSTVGDDEVDPLKCWVREHSGSSSWTRHPIKLRVGKGATGWHREYFLQLERRWAVTQEVADNEQSRISVTIEARHDRRDSHHLDTLSSAQGSIIPQALFENFKSPYDQSTKLSILGSPILTAATVADLLSFPVGGRSTAEGAGAVALGHSSNSSGNYSFSSGFDAVASGTHSFSFGQASVAAGDYAISTSGSEATGHGSLAMVWGKASGRYASSLGLGSAAVGDRSIALGQGQSLGTFSLSSGQNTIADSYAEVALGLHNLASGGNPLVSQSQDPLLSLGNGSAILPSNALTVLKNGETTLTNKFWDQALPSGIPSTPNSAEGNALVVEGHAVFKGKIVLIEPQGDISMGIYGN